MSKQNQKVKEQNQQSDPVQNGNMNQCKKANRLYSKKEKLQRDPNYVLVIDLLIALRNVCRLTVEEAAIGLDIDRSTLTKYENFRSKISLNRAIRFRRYYFKYITEHHIVVTEKILKLEDNCEYVHKWGEENLPSSLRSCPDPA